MSQNQYHIMSIFSRYMYTFGGIFGIDEGVVESPCSQDQDNDVEQRVEDEKRPCEYSWAGHPLHVRVMERETKKDQKIERETASPPIFVHNGFHSSNQSIHMKKTKEKGFLFTLPIFVSY